MTIETPLAKAKGMGSAHEGAHHWMHQRISAVSNLVLLLWLSYSFVTMPDWSYEAFTGWVSSPCNAILVILAVISSFYHAALGVQVIAEDYISCKCFRIAKVIGTKLFFIAAAVA